MKITAIVPSAGLGLRLKSKVAKPLVVIDKKPIFIHTLEKLSSVGIFEQIIVGFNEKDLEKAEELINKGRLSKVKVVSGGSSRKETVKNCLEFVSDDTDLVLIHDGVRPFIDQKIINSVIEAAYKYKAAVVGVPMKSTVKKINLNELEIEATLRRQEIWEIQTPQVFERKLIMRAYYQDINNIEAPDDSFLVERLGHKVVLVLGSYFNIKITTFEDLILAEAINRFLKRKDESYKSWIRV